MPMNTKAMIALAEIIGTIHYEYAPMIQRDVVANTRPVSAITFGNNIKAAINLRFVELVKNRGDIVIKSLKHKNEQGEYFSGNDALDIIMDEGHVGASFVNNSFSQHDPCPALDLFIYYMNDNYSFHIN